MKFVSFVTLFTVALFFPYMVSASVVVTSDGAGHGHGHEGDFFIEVEDGHLHVHPRVLESELEGPSFVTDEPGFDSEHGTFTFGEEIGVNLLLGLKRWNGDGFVAGFELAASSDGVWHKHLGFSLNSAGGGDPRDGIYLLEMELYKTKPDKESTISNPIWMVFNLNRAEAEHTAAVNWVALDYGLRAD